MTEAAAPAGSDVQTERRERERVRTLLPSGEQCTIFVCRRDKYTNNDFNLKMEDVKYSR